MLTSYQKHCKTTMTITNMHQTLGEKAFRAYEAKTIANIPHQHSCIIASGGGSMLDDANVKHLKSLGKIIYLKTDVATLYQRIMQGNHLPSFIDAKNASTQLTQYLHSRDALYLGTADTSINTSGKTIADIVALIHTYGRQHGQ
jgi:shikimate kinase